ncbi:hypothetical protein CAPTEDRAFT_209377 [Capitella teleta]|uniref:G-protein coupled receptors family 1 profile domain-containing protein n=1 Tax=Capitella teleta TaxID=283909 RepID=R7T670_CAPTE|nr:hypothetical protein CAPTEDRAFT_209377 [Capitella teleta]|eukprot:ELT88738.1 hypothetical protein CAPTEDRAFT_209377 [Capitella teleta]
MESSTSAFFASEKQHLPETPLYQEVIMAVVCIECLLILAANPVTILAIIQSKLAQKSPAHFLIGALSVTDFLSGLLFLLLQSLGWAIATIGITKAIIELNWLTCLLSTLMMPCSLITSFLIGVDRFMAVTFPVKYKLHMKVKTAAFMVLGQWIFVSAIVLPAAIYKRTTEGPLKFITNPPDIYPDGYAAYVTTPLAFILLIGNALLYVGVFWMHKVQTKKVANVQSNQVQARGRRLTRLCIIVVGVLIACWAPVTIVSALPVPRNNPLALQVYKFVYSFCFVINIIPAFANNILYAWQHNDYRRAYLKLIGSKKTAPSSVQT